LTDSSAAWSAEFTSTAAANPADSDNANATQSIKSFFSMASTPLRAEKSTGERAAHAVSGRRA
jgi:hypothetical protein